MEDDLKTYGPDPIKITAQINSTLEFKYPDWLMTVTWLKKANSNASLKMVTWLEAPLILA